MSLVAHFLFRTVRDLVGLERLNLHILRDRNIVEGQCVPFLVLPCLYIPRIDLLLGGAFLLALANGQLGSGLGSSHCSSAARTASLPLTEAIESAVQKLDLLERRQRKRA
jgi:hypothetical protein